MYLPNSRHTTRCSVRRRGLGARQLAGEPAGVALPTRPRLAPARRQSVSHDHTPTNGAHGPRIYALGLPPGVGPEFTEAQLRKQHRLLSLRYHPDAAARNGVEPAEATLTLTLTLTLFLTLS
jgi:hypothetical protein